MQGSETYFGGPQSDARGRGALGKTMVVIAVAHVDDEDGLERARMTVISDGKITTLAGVLTACITPLRGHHRRATVLPPGHARSLFTRCTSRNRSGRQVRELPPTVLAGQTMDSIVCKARYVSFMV